MAKYKHIDQYDNDLYDDIERIKAAILDSTADTKEKASEMLSNTIEDVKKQSLHVKDKVIHHTTEKPLQSLGIALLVGVAIGFLVRK